MANYIAHHTKKTVRLGRLEQELSRSIRKAATREEQLQLAEEIRLARIRALRATRATFPPKAVSQINRGTALDEKIVYLERMTREDILKEFEHD